MNYRHAYHAGNFADVLKHAVLVLVIEHMKLKPSPFRVVDTHAGVGLYDLKSDPDERRNLIQEPRQEGKIEDLQAELTRLMRATGISEDKMPLDEGVKAGLPDQKIR